MWLFLGSGGLILRRELHAVRVSRRRHRTTTLRYLADRNKRQETPNQMATAASRPEQHRRLEPDEVALHATIVAPGRRPCVPGRDQDKGWGVLTSWVTRVMTAVCCALEIPARRFGHSLLLVGVTWTAAPLHPGRALSSSAHQLVAHRYVGSTRASWVNTQKASRSGIGNDESDLADDAGLAGSERRDDHA